jgi:hypothetical protein
MATAFQDDAFQNDAFQIGADAPLVTVMLLAIENEVIRVAGMDAEDIRSAGLTSEAWRVARADEESLEPS